jgi:hypothetical protein
MLGTALVHGQQTQTVCHLRHRRSVHTQSAIACCSTLQLFRGPLHARSDCDGQSAVSDRSANAQPAVDRGRLHTECTVSSQPAQSMHTHPAPRLGCCSC